MLLGLKRAALESVAVHCKVPVSGKLFGSPEKAAVVVHAIVNPNKALSRSNDALT